jgi:hypothetical protein
VVVLTIIVISALGAMVLSAVLAIALARIAALADRDAEQLLEQYRAMPTTGVYRHRYTGVARAQGATIARPSSIAVSSSRIRVATQRLPVSSCASRRPRVWLNTPGGKPRP